MKILFIASHLNGTDGWSRYTLDFVNGLLDKKKEVVCAISRKVEELDVNQHVLVSTPEKAISNIFSYIKKLRLHLL